MVVRGTQAREGAGGGASRRARRLALLSASAAVAAAALAAPGGSGVAARAALGADATVQARDNFFQPSAVTINQGETVTWTNAGSNPHNVRFDDGSFEEPAAPSTSSWSVQRTFNAPGTFPYYCEAHGGPGGSGMAGTVTVNAAATPPGPPPAAPPPPGATPPGYTQPGATPPGPGAPAAPSPGAPDEGRSSTTVTLRVSDATPARGSRVRFFGSVRPERDGRLVRLQRRTRGGSYRTVAKVRLRDAGTSRSRYGKRLRVLRDAVFRARLPADRDHEAGTSRTRLVNVR
jgi:plastocyanin